MPAVECSSAEGNQHEGGWIGSCVSILHSNKAHHLPCLRLSVCWRGWDARLFWSMIPRGAHPSPLATHNSVKLPQLPGCSSAVHQWCLWESAWGCACSGVTASGSIMLSNLTPLPLPCIVVCTHWPGSEKALKKLPSPLSLPSLPTLPTLAFTPMASLCYAVRCLRLRTHSPRCLTLEASTVAMLKGLSSIFLNLHPPPHTTTTTLTHLS